MQRDDEGSSSSILTENGSRAMRPIVIGEKLELRDDRLGFTIAQVAKGRPARASLRFCSRSRRRKPRRSRIACSATTTGFLQDTLAWWSRKLAPTVHVASGNRRLDDLVEGLKVLLLVQQDVQGGVCPMVNFKGVWLRDSNGPILGFLHTGLYEEARRLLTYYRQASAIHQFTAREFPLDLDVRADPDLTPEQWAASPARIAARCPRLSSCSTPGGSTPRATRASSSAIGPMCGETPSSRCSSTAPTGRSRPSTAMRPTWEARCYSLFPRGRAIPMRSMRQDAYTADSMFEYAVAHEAMVRLARRLGHEEDAARFAESAARMRQSIERHFWLPEERRYAPVLSPVDFSPHCAPFAPINLRPLWLGYLSPDDPKASSNLEGTLRWLWRPPGLVRMTPFMDYFIGCAPGNSSTTWPPSAIPRPRRPSPP